MPQIEIDGKKLEVRKDSIIIDVARELGIWIPTLCHHPALSPYGACRICLVEIIRKGWSELVTACSYPIRDDIRIFTDSDKTLRARKGIMHLLLARCPENPELLSLAKKMCAGNTSPYPKVTEAQRDCILCGLCVNVCEKLIGASAISFADRGVNRTVAAPFRAASEDCIGCGACANVCPVGTIKLRWTEDTVEVSPFKNLVKLIKCRECGKSLTGEAVASLVNNALNLKNHPEITSTCDVCKRKLLLQKLQMIPTATDKLSVKE